MVTNEFIESLYEAIGDYAFNYITNFKDEERTELSVTTIYNCQNMISVTNVGRTLIIDKDNVEIHFNDIQTDNSRIFEIQRQLKDLGVDFVIKDGQGLIFQNDEVIYKLPVVKEKTKDYIVYQIGF